MRGRGIWGVTKHTVIYFLIFWVCMCAKVLPLSNVGVVYVEMYTCLTLGLTKCGFVIELDIFSATSSVYFLRCWRSSRKYFLSDFV